MKTKMRNKTPELVYRGGKPAAVILDIDVYQEMLERLEDRQDAARLEEVRKKPLKFRRLGEFLKEHRAGV